MMPFCWIFSHGGYFLESKDNAKIKHLRGLIELNSARKKHQQTVLEGTHLCLTWLQQQKKIFFIYDRTSIRTY